MIRLRSATFGLAAIALSIGLASCSSGPDRDDEGAITETGELDAFSIKLGDCLDNPLPGVDEGEFASVSAVPCADPHDMEAYHLFDLPEGPFPGEEAVNTAANDGCFEAFEPYVGTDYASSAYDFSFFTPLAVGWEQGDHEIVCLVFDFAEAKVTGSVEGIEIGTETEAGPSELDVFSIELGDCLNDPVSGGDEGEFNSVTSMSCDEPHDMEAFHVFNLPDGPFPGEAAVSSLASEGCFDAFEPFVGLDYASSIYDFSTFTPTALGWEQGDQEAVCLVFDLAGEKLSSSVKGSGL